MKYVFTVNIVSIFLTHFLPGFLTPVNFFKKSLYKTVS